MPLYSDHINNMYYSGSTSYNSVPFGYSSSFNPLGTSYSASYLNSGGNYSSHSSLGGYSRTPYGRWTPSSSRRGIPLLSTISERGTSSPTRINSPRRVHVPKRSYVSSSYTPRPININTADIDVSKDKYSHKKEDSFSKESTETSSKELDAEKNPFMPRVDEKPVTGIDTSPGLQRSTIKRGRTVVRLHTIKRKERDSPRKPTETQQNIQLENSEARDKNNNEQQISDEQLRWRERLSEDLIYKDKKEKKTLGAKLVEKFKVKDINNDVAKNDSKGASMEETECLSRIPLLSFSSNGGWAAERRYSMELLAEQANVFDSLIRGENLSTATLDLSKVGTEPDHDNKIQLSSSTKRRKSSDKGNPLVTTKSDHSLNTQLKSCESIKQSSKRRSLKKSSSGGHICRLDSITEFPKESLITDLLPIEENRSSIKNKSDQGNKKVKNKITSTVEVVSPTSPLKLKVENITVEVKHRSPKKEIIFSSSLEEIIPEEVNIPSIPISNKNDNAVVNIEAQTLISKDDEDNFWNKIGKRETVYLLKRKENIKADEEKNRRAIFWFPEEEGIENNGNETLKPNKDKIDFQFKTKNRDDFITELGLNDFDTHTDISATTLNNSSKIENIDSTDRTNIPEETKICISNQNLNCEHRIIELIQKETIVIKEQSLDETKTDMYNLITLNKNNQLDDTKEAKLPNNGIMKEKDINFPEIKAEQLKEINIQYVEKYSAKEPIAEVRNDSKTECTQKLIKSENYEQITEVKIISPVEKECQDLKRSSSKLPTIPLSSSQKHSKEMKIPNVEILNTKETIVDIQNNSKTKYIQESEIQTNPLVIKKSDNIERLSPKLPLPSSSPRKPIKDEPALRPLIATPRPLQKKAPQVIHSSSSSESSSDEESTNNDADDSESSESSTEFYECENNPDGRTSTGSNDSGFDSSAPTSPAGFVHVKKDCDVICHRKCEKLTANLCGVNQRLLVEALSLHTLSKKGADTTGASSTTTSSPQPNISQILEQELEQSTAYALFRKTGHFTPPAKSIPRFRKYNIEDFHFIKVLGKGSFGKVMLAELRETEYYYAVKCLKKDVVLEDDDVECTLIERKVLALGTNHPYLCHLFATFQTDSHLFFVMEYLNGGDLMFHIQQSGRFPESRGRFYAAEIVSGLKFLHKRGIVYRDLKLDNILLDYEGHVRIADFGMCKLQIYLDKTADTFCGTPDYMAPEIIKGLKYNQTVDWWSFGVLLYEMLIGQSPFSGCDEDELFWSICNEMPSYPRFLSHEALTILNRLLDKDAKTRLGGTDCMHGDIRDQDFFRSIAWDKLERRELETPFKPRVRHPLDTQYFDRAFTGERARLTAVEAHVLRSMAQEPFRGFSYTNPNATDR